MCWNENVSLNTFLFALASCVFIWYNNNYTQYKIKEFNNPFVYLALFSFSVMQLLDYFFWRSLKNKDDKSNKFFSIIGWIFIRIVQPLALILSIPEKYSHFKNPSLLVYFFTLVLTTVYKEFFNPIQFKTVLEKDGHLDWKFINLDGFEKSIVGLYFLCFISAFLNFPEVTIFIFLILLFCYLNYDLTWGSMWCWFTNIVFLYFVTKILFWLPFVEYNKLC